MKRLLLFAMEITQELGDRCCTSTTRDCKTIASRFEHEGLSFLTITLANFGADFQKSLDQGFVGDDQYLGFSRTGGLPRFLGGFLRRVFDAKSGRLLDAPDIEAIHALRQITLMWAKINLPCTPARVEAAIEGYIKCEQETRDADRMALLEVLEDYRRIGALLWADVLSRSNEDVYYDRVIPKHGPGKTADRLTGNGKWEQREWPERLEALFPYGTSAYPIARSEHDLDHVRFLEPGAERPVRVITVPKTLKTPRIIAIEPTCMQYMQQGLERSIRKSLHASDAAWRIVGYTSQVPNQHLACEGSRNGAYATLDLREASDRVSNQHVRGLLQNHLFLFEAVDASRSRKADVPGHGVIRLAKFASMGSALTFPLEAMVFATVVFYGIEQWLSRPLTRKDVESFAGRVRVYGDDIIVPVETVQCVLEALEAFGFRVNSSKSFWTGKFRESCGKEYFDGHDVSIVKLRQLFPTTRTDLAERIISTIDTRNALYRAGLWRSARWIDDLLEGIKIPMPVVTDTAPGKGRFSFLGPDLTGPLDKETQRPLVKGVVVSARIPPSPLDGPAALLKCLTRLELRNDEGEPPSDFGSGGDNPFSLPAEGVGHLDRSGRPHTVSTKVRWFPST